MVPAVGEIYRNCEIKSIAPYGAFVEIAPGREGLCHISELSADWLAKAEDAFKVGDHVDVKLIEVNEKGQLRLSRKALLPDPDPEKSEKNSTSSLNKDGSVSPKTPDKVKFKKASSTGSLADANAEHPKEKSTYVRSISPTKSSDVKKLSGIAKDRPYTKKGKIEDSGRGAGIDISS